MRKRLLPAKTRPIDVRKTRSISSADVAKKKEAKSKSNETRNPKDSNMTAKKVVKKAPLKSKVDKIAKPKKKVQVKKVKEAKKKYVKKSQVQPKSSESDNGESSSSSKEPVEVVIHVKKPQQKAQPKKTKKSGVSSGKIGKRKPKQEDGPGKTLLKNISGSSEKLETVVSTILEVAVLTKKVKPKVQTKKTVKKTTVKKKPDKKVKKELTSDQGETEEEQKKEIKKKPIKVKKEMKTEIKEEVKEEKTKKEMKKEEDLKKKDKMKPKKSAETKKEGEGSKDAAVAGCSKQAAKKKTEKPTKKSKQKTEVVKSEKLVKDDVKSPKAKKTRAKAKNEKNKKEKSSQDEKSEDSDDEDAKTRRMKLFGFWEGPKRHREASLNALAKVHCLYENESKVMEILDKKPRVEKRKNEKAVKVEPSDSGDENSGKEATRRTLRTAPGIRSVGRHYDVETSSSSSPSSDESDHEKKVKKKPPQTPRALPAIKDKPEKSEDEKKKEEPPRKVRKRRKRCELMMDLKDMVVRKRMASLNASAMLAATYSMEKRSIRSDDDPRRARTSDDSTSTDMDVESSDDEVIVSGSSKKVAVIVNQDTDVTITGLYTTRSTRHCSITGMQYRISSTSHTQTESTAVTTETVIHTTDHQSGSSVEAVGSPGAGCKSYTPLGALSSMQPPGNTSPLMRRHPCSTSAFSAPYHPHQEIHGYYQPAGPLISHHHHHSSASTSSSVPTVSGVSPSKASPGLDSPRAEGSAEEYRPPPGFPAAYPPPYSYQYIQPPPYHQDCYSPSYYHKYPNYRRYWPTPPGPPSTQMVASETYPPQGGPLVETFPPHPPPPPHHSGYGVYAYSAPPPPPCYSHSPTSRGLAFIDPSFQCPCPMQSCPKNVHTGPLTGASKGSGQTVQAQNQQGNQQNVCLDSQEVSAPLPPVALTLPLETTSAHLGPPSPARGSAGMPPPASPALSTARNPQSWSPPTAHPVPIKEEDIAPKMLPTPPPEQTIVDLPMTDCLQRRPHPTKRKSVDIETEVNAKKRRAATPILHELQPVRQTNNCPSDDDDIKPPVLEKQVDLHEKILDLKVVPQEKLMENKDSFLEKPLLIEQIVDEKKLPKPEKPPKKEKVEKKVLTDKKNIQAKVEKKTKKKLMPKISLGQKPVNGLKVKKDQPKTKNCREGKKACKKTNIVIKKEIEESPLVRTPTLKWSNGWSWEGEPFKAKVFLTSDEPVLRTCYPAMRHVEGDVICPRDCILLKSGTKKQQLPFVAKVTAMWENPEDGEMIVSLLWYYRPEHTEQGRLPLQPEDEIFASRHKDINSVACIEDKCYVLSYYEYCRYKMSMKMIESGITEDVRSVVPDLVGGYPRESRLPKGQISKDLLFFCRRVYDFRQKRLLKNP